MKLNRRYPIGAELLSAGGAHFRVWAPSASHGVAQENARPGARTARELSV